jgi:2,3-diaminopropionate biosynthesis protein SbnA
MIITKIEQIASKPMFFKISNEFAGLPIYLKLEGLNIAGSIKLKTAINLIDSLHKNGCIIKDKSRIIESSSGNLGVALSIVCKSRKIPFICVTDPNTNKNNIHLMNLYGAKVICVTDRDENGGYLGSRIKLINQMILDDPTLIWTNQYANQDNPTAHYLTTALEISKNFPKIDYLFIGAGTAGTLMGCAKHFKNVSPDTKIIAVDARGSVTFGGVAQKRCIPGLGTSKRPSIVNESIVDEIVIVDEKSTVDTCYKILDLNGLLVGGSTGTVLNAIYQIKDRFLPTDVIVTISPDFGERYLNTIYDSNWIKEKIEYDRNC